MKLKKEILLLSGVLVISFFIVEIGLRVFTVFPIHGVKSNKKPHAILGYTLDPSKLSDVDAGGFRNPQEGGHHEIVAIGDSHTQGFNVEWQDAWPYQLGRQLNKSVYNYGVAGYGIYHYLYLAKEAVKHRPKYVLLGLYPYNDIKPIVCRKVASSYFQELLNSGVINAECPEGPKVKVGISHYSAFFSALKYVDKLYINPVAKKMTSTEMYYDFGGIFIKKKEVIKQDRADISRKVVRDNYEASKSILSLIDTELKRNGIKFGIVIIPSKGVVFERWATINRVPIPEGFSVEPEKTLIKKYVTFFDEKNIPTINGTNYVVEAFSKSVSRNELFYPLNDEHPMIKGYESYSKAAAELITRINQVEGDVGN